MQIVVRVVATARTSRGSIEVQVIRISRHGKSHDDMQRVFDRLQQDLPFLSHGLRITENTVTFTTRLRAMKPWMVEDARKVITAALDDELV